MSSKLKKVSIEDIANKEAESKVNRAPAKLPSNDEIVPVYNKPKGEFENKEVNSHPVLKKLKAKLGIKPLEIYTKSIMVDGDKFDFSFSEYSEELVVFCASEYRRAIMTHGEELAMKRFDILRIGCSLVAIDNEPIYEVFGVELELEELDRFQKNKYDLSDRLRKECAKIFCQKVLREFRGFISELETFFIEKIVNIANIKAFDSLKEGQNVYICEVPGCTFIHKDYPMFDGDKELPFICAIHAVPLKKALNPAEKADLPLV